MTAPETPAGAFRRRLARGRARPGWANPPSWPPYWWVWACGALAILGMATGNAIFVAQFHRAALDDARGEIARLGQADAAAIERSLANVDRVVAALAAGGPVGNAALAAQLGAMPQLAGLAVIGGDGAVQASAGEVPTLRGDDLAAARRAEPGPYIGAPARDPKTGARSILWARWAAGRGGTVAAARVRLNYFADFFAATGFGRDGAVALWRDDGTLLVRAPSAAAAAGEIVMRQKLRGYPLAVAVSGSKAAALAHWRGETATIGAATLARIIVIALIAALVRRHLIARDQVAAVRSTIAAEAGARTTLEQAISRSEVAIREHERAEAALRESEQRFRDVAEVAADVIWETGPDHRFTFFSGGSADELRSNIGFEIPQLIGKTRWELGGGDPVNDPVWRDHKADLDAHRPFRQFRYAVVSRSGSRVYYSVNGKAVFDAAGRFAGYRGIAANETRIIEARSRAERAEALLADAVESISEGFVIYDGDDRLALCNSAFLKLYPSNRKILVPGNRFEDILRDGLERSLYADAIGREEEWLAERMEQHRNPQGPVEARHANGRWLLICERPMRGGGTAGLRIDITAMKAAQAALRDSEERLNRAQRMARMGCDTRDLRTGRMEWSDETFRIFGVSREHFAPTTEGLLGLMHPDDRPIILRGRAEIDRGVCPPPCEFRIIRPDGAIRYIAREWEVLRDEAGAPVMAAGTIRDITDLRASQARQKELERQLQHSQKMKALGTLAGGIAHDLNNTLVPILSLSKLVAERLPPDGTDREDLETIIFASERARDLLQQILMFSRNQNSVKEDVDLAALTRKALRMLRVTVPPTVRLVHEIAPVPPILGDAGQLQRVVVNLVTNSVQAIGKAAGTLTVTVGPAAPGEGAPEAGPDRGAVMLSVTDTGCGMDAATVERIFEPFYTTKRVGEGTGLGLSVVHGIVADHGGRIEVASERSKGAVFKIVLPASGGGAVKTAKTTRARHRNGIAAAVPA